jgi:hypothetical protein
VLATTFRAQLERAKNKEANREKNERKERRTKEDHRRVSGEWIRTIDLRVMSPTSYRAALPRHLLPIFYFKQMFVVFKMNLGPSGSGSQKSKEQREETEQDSPKKE